MPALPRLLVLLSCVWCGLGLALALTTLDGLLGPGLHTPWTLVLPALGALVWNRASRPPPDVLGRLVPVMMGLAALLAGLLALLAFLPLAPSLVDAARGAALGTALVLLVCVGALVPAVTHVLDARQPHRGRWPAVGLAMVLLGAAAPGWLWAQHILVRLPARLPLSAAAVILALAGPLLRRTSGALSTAFDTGSVHRVVPGAPAPAPAHPLTLPLAASAMTGGLAAVWWPVVLAWPLLLGVSLRHLDRAAVATPRLAAWLLWAALLAAGLALALGGGR